MKKYRYIIFLLLIYFIPKNIYAQKIFYADKADKQNVLTDSSDLLYSVYLMGDIETSDEGKRNLSLMKKYLDNETEQSTVVLLGDVLRPLGLPDSNDVTFDAADKKLKFILNTFDAFKGRLFVIPGNHDWARGRKQGLENLNNEEEAIEEYFDRGNVFLPDNGCPGPVEVNLTDDITLVIFDSQWWFEHYNKPNSSDCNFKEKEDLFIQINDILARNADKKVIFATHHPLYSVGKHGGYFPKSYFLFPFQDIESWLYLPFPGIVYTGYRKYIGNIQDLSHPLYKEFRQELTGVLSQYPNVIYAAGHEHNLQYFNSNNLHHIISGGGGDGAYIAKRKKKADFAFLGGGFCKLSFFKDGDVWMQFITDDGSDTGKIIYTKKLFNKPVFVADNFNNSINYLDFSDSTVVKSISNLYNKGQFYRSLMGNNYRDIWSAKVEFPVFDIGTIKGGLTIVKRGGGMQTKSLRLVDKNGKEYVLRSVNKYVENALPDYLHNTIAVDAVQDEISASNPYAAITLPKLADAAGVMHTNPKLYWLPDDPRLGIYQKDFANNIYLFEERPAGNRDDVASFGYSDKIISTQKVISKIHDDADNVIDQKAVLRARLFDILINDWDRHDDQWRWARFKDNKKNIYRPIPRDRDQAFFVNEGAIMWLASRKWIARKFQGFDDDIKDINGLCYNARYFDRTFLTELNLNDWLEIATEMKQNITDSIIHTAILSLPESVYDSIGFDIEKKLVARRNKLDVFAKQYYQFLAEKVDVVGTNNNNLFKVTRESNGNTMVTVFELSDKKRKVKDTIFKREFLFDETKEIRLYGLGGNDIFDIKGTADKGIVIRIIGGDGNDKLVDKSSVAGIRNKNIFYDTKNNQDSLKNNTETRIILSKNKSINDYNRKQFKYNKTMPLASVGYVIDDGIYLGGGFKMQRYNFRDSTIQKFTANLAIQTGAFFFDYELLYSAFSQKYDLLIDANVSFLQNVNNFYGLGNETVKLIDDKNFYRVRYEYAWFNPMLKRTISDDFYYTFGTYFQYYKVADTVDKFIGELYSQTLDATAYDAHIYAGFNTSLVIDTRDNKINPHRGMLWETKAQGYISVLDEGYNFLKLNSDMSFYLSFKYNPNFVMAFRVGGAANIGDYIFYHANFLGNKTNLRGFRANRFAGDEYVYQNTDIRIKITDFNNYLFRGQMGISLFNDIGRVWLEDENSEKWHDGYGGGIWAILFDSFVCNVNYNRSSEDRFFDFKLSYMF